MVEFVIKICFNVLKISTLCSTRLYLFDQNTGEFVNIEMLLQFKITIFYFNIF